MSIVRLARKGGWGARVPFCAGRAGMGCGASTPQVVADDGRAGAVTLVEPLRAGGGGNGAAAGRGSGGAHAPPGTAGAALAAYDSLQKAPPPSSFDAMVGASPAQNTAVRRGARCAR